MLGHLRWTAKEEHHTGKHVSLTVHMTNALKRTMQVRVVSLTCAALTVHRLCHVAPRLPLCGRPGGAVLMQGDAHLGGNESRRRGALGGAEGAVLAAPRGRGVRDDGVDGSSGPASRRRDQRGLLLLGRRCCGGPVGLLSVVGSWSSIGPMLLLQWLLAVLGV